MDRFRKDGRLIIPLMERQKGTKPFGEELIRYVVTEAYCPNGCSVIDREHRVHDIPGLRIKFKRPGMEGESRV